MYTDKINATAVAVIYVAILFHIVTGVTVMNITIFSIIQSESPQRNNIFISIFDVVFHNVSVF